MVRKSVKVTVIGEHGLEIVLDVLNPETFDEQPGEDSSVKSERFSFPNEVLSLNSVNFARNLDLSPIFVMRQATKLSFKLIKASSSTFSAAKKT